MGPRGSGVGLIHTLTVVLVRESIHVLKSIEMYTSKRSILLYVNLKKATYKKVTGTVSQA